MQLLHVSPMWRLVGSVASSNSADGVLRLAIPLLALADHGPSGAALVTTAALVPWLVLSVPVGVWLDRFPPSLASRCANGVRAALLIGATVSLVAADQPTLVFWTMLALLVGACEVVVDLAAQVIVPDVAPDAQLVTVNARISGTQIAANEFIGPAVGGVTVASFGSGALAVAASMFGFAAILLPASSPITRGVDPPSLRTATRFFVARRDLVLLACAVGALNISSAIVFASLPGFGIRVAGISESELGAAIAVGGLFGLIGSYAAPRISRRFGPGRSVAAGVLGMAVAPVVLPVAPSHWGIVAAVGVVSAATPVCAVGIVTHRQRTTPQRLLGSISALFQTVGIGAGTLGGLIATLGIERLSFDVTFLLAAAVSVAAFVVLVVGRPLPRHA